MEIIEHYSFQVDSEIVKEVYQNQDNFLIEYSTEVPKDYCIIYFSSNDIYYPNTETAFREYIIEKNRFEWYGNRINKGYKHIFIRDIQKQWYLNGINTIIDNPIKLLNFLKIQTKGFKTITLGSSSGGYAAVIYGQGLKSEKIYSFNGQFELNSLLKHSNKKTDPVIFYNSNNKKLRPWYNTLNFIIDPSSIFYFNSTKSHWDCEQEQYIYDKGLTTIRFKSRNHGLPFYRFNLQHIINLPYDKVIELSKKDELDPFVLSQNLIGLFPTIKSYLLLLSNYAVKLTLRKAKLILSGFINAQR